MAIKSLLARKNKLSDPKKQLEFLAQGIFEDGELPTFNEKLKAHQLFPIQPSKIEILQLNLGYMCNQVCAHCHVDAGPDRKEIMTKETLQDCLNFLNHTKVATIDLTGGAPEMNPHFRWFVEEASKTGVEDVIVRSNLTIINANKKYYDLPQFFKAHNIHVVSSLPHYSKDNTDRQRGDGVFDRSIQSLKALNTQGYGVEGTGLQLDLVYNPVGAFLPGNQQALENDFKQRLKDDFDIHFNKLFTITNLPISRYLEYLIASDNYEDYMYTLVEAFNPTAVKNVMCTNTVSVDWQGYLYDCDFNQMLGLKVASESQHISTINTQLLEQRTIRTSQHCYGCTAGAGSSCQGAVVDE